MQERLGLSKRNVLELRRETFPKRSTTWQISGSMCSVLKRLLNSADEKCEHQKSLEIPKTINCKKERSVILICVSPPDGIPMAHLVRLPGYFKNLVSGVNPGWDVLHCDALIKDLFTPRYEQGKDQTTGKKNFCFRWV